MIVRRQREREKVEEKEREERKEREEKERVGPRGGNDAIAPSLSFIMSLEGSMTLSFSSAYVALLSRLLCRQGISGRTSSADAFMFARRLKR